MDKSHCIILLSVIAVLLLLAILYKKFKKPSANPTQASIRAQQSPRVQNPSKALSMVGAQAMNVIQQAELGSANPYQDLNMPSRVSAAQSPNLVKRMGDNLRDVWDSLPLFTHPDTFASNMYYDEQQRSKLSHCIANEYLNDMSYVDAVKIITNNMMPDEIHRMIMYMDKCLADTGVLAGGKGHWGEKFTNTCTSREISRELSLFDLIDPQQTDKVNNIIVASKVKCGGAHSKLDYGFY